MAAYPPSHPAPYPPPVSAYNQPNLQYPSHYTSGNPCYNPAPLVSPPCPQPVVQQGAYPEPPPPYSNAANYPASGSTPTPAFNPQISPSAPDMSKVEKIPGYENVKFEEETVIPPFVPAWEPNYDERRELQSLPSLTEEDVREAAVEHFAEDCCRSTNFAQNMIITNITMMSAFHYKLETFSEKRSFAWRFVPFMGQLIDGPTNGPAPQPWDVIVTPRWNFKEGKRKIEVPHTAFVKPCHKCVGNARIRCEACSGNGNFRCNKCGGRGRKHREVCRSCNGAGMKRCNTCCGHGQVACNTCNGKGQLKCFVELIVTWIVHIDDYISEICRFPKELILGVTGKTALEEEFPRVSPILHTQDEALRKVSNDFIRKHNTAFPNERILKQRHTIQLVPIGEVNYTLEEKPGMYYVYGYEHKVYFQKQPEQFCIII